MTGGAGFIGSNLCEAFLDQGNEVRCLDDLSTGYKANIEEFLDRNGFQFIQGDIRDPEVCRKAVNGVDLVFHQAALGSVPRSIDDPISTNSVNVDGSLNILVASRDAGVDRFIYAASSSVYGDIEDLPKIEERTGDPLSPYAVSKVVNEYYAKVFSYLYGMNAIGLRYFNVFGPKQDPDGPYAAAIPRFIRTLLEGKSPLIHGDGKQTRDFTYVKNVIQANSLAAIAEMTSGHEVYNVACGESLEVGELVGILKDILNRKVSGISDIKVEYGPERVGDVKYSLASIDKIQKELGYEPEYSVKEGLEEAMDWYVNRFRSEGVER